MKRRLRTPGWVAQGLLVFLVLIGIDKTRIL
jgi:hypothetical protein